MPFVNATLNIPDEELVFSAGPSQGPGGQNVNKVATRIILSFDLLGSPSLSENQKKLLQARLGRRISKSGILRLVSQETRSQRLNKEAAVRRFCGLLAEGLKISKPRKKTRMPSMVKKKRLEAKRRRGAVKFDRSRQAVQKEFN